MLCCDRLRRQLSVLTLAALAIVALPCCVPTTWMPDSSGFVYISPLKGKNPGDRPTGQLVHFDINKKMPRVVVADLGVDGGWPAVSPDGQQIAVARFQGQPLEAKTVQIVLYDWDGKKVKESKAFPWTAKPEDKKAPNSFGKDPLVFWSPKNDMLVVSDFENSGIFNLRTETMKMLGKAIPFIHGGTPIPPDGKGCLMALANKEKGKQDSLVFMEWDGTQHPIDTQPLEALEPKNEKGLPKGPMPIALLVPITMQSWWDGNTAYAGLKHDKMIYNIDTIKKTAVVSPALRDLVAAGTKLGGQHRFDFAGNISVHVDQYDDGPAGGRKLNKVSVVNHQTKKEQVLVEKMPAQVFGTMSPNGQYLALCLYAMQPTTNPTLLVISHKGELVSRIDVGK